MIEVSDRVINMLKYRNKVLKKRCEKCTTEKVEYCKTHRTGIIIDGVTINYGCMTQNEIKKLNKILC